MRDLDQEPGGEPERAAPPDRGRRSRAGWILAALAVLLLAWLAVEWATWPDVERLATENPTTTAFIERHREAGGEVAWRWVPYAAIAESLKRAVLVAEDIGFFSHDGFAVEEMEVALRQAWERREMPRGASTITQQLAKNLWLSPSRSPLRKVREAILTWQLERHLDKRRILELYLNVAELGPGVYGAEAAARRFFGRSAAGLTPHEAAQLAASLPRPKSWHPGVESAGYRSRVATIERRMGKAAWLRRVI